MANPRSTAVGAALAAGVFGGLVEWGTLQGPTPLDTSMVVASYVFGPLVLLVPIGKAVGVGIICSVLVYLFVRVLLFQPGSMPQGNDELPSASVAGNEVGEASATDDRMEVYGITFDGAKYRFGEFKYDKLADAINYAKIVRSRGDV